MKKILVCSYCETDISKPVHINTSIQNYDSFAHYEWKNAANSGEALIVRCTQNFHAIKLGADIEYALAYWLNTDDKSDTTILDPHLSHGCCGPRGGINTRCACSALIGSISADCGGPHFFAPDQTKTKWIDYIEDENLREADRQQRIYQNSRIQKLRNKRQKK